MEAPEFYIYETLDALPLSSVPSQSYSVFRNQITSTPPTSPQTAAVDYFSLEVVPAEAEAEEEEEEEEGRAEPSPPKGQSLAGEVLASEGSWFRAGGRFKSPMLQLHKEILDFCSFVSPTPEEEASRSAAVERVFDVVRYIWPHCNVEVFGSFRTGLYLPTSDVDVVIFDSKVKTPQMGLYALARALSQRSIAKKIQVIAKARVPIIKFIEKQSGVAFDISFDAQNGPKAADFIKDVVTKIPPLKPLCLILKIFLQQRELNEVFLGGIGSYALLTMLIAQLQLHWRGQDILGNQMAVEHNLGVLLVNFFDLYGCKLNIWDVGISCNTAGTFFSKSSKGFLNGERPGLISIEDPQAPENDIGRGSFNYFKVKSAFGMAYSLLTDAKTIMELGPHKSILGTIIRPDPVLLKRKGGYNGEITFENLLPGAEQPMPLQFGNRGDVFYNWRLADDEPLPREVIEETFSYSRKKKVLKPKRRSDESDFVTTPNISGKGRASRESRKKLKRKECRDNYGLNGCNSLNSIRRSRHKLPV